MPRGKMAATAATHTPAMPAPHVAVPASKRHSVDHKLFDVAVGALLRKARIRRGASQQLVSDRLGLSFQQLQKYETGVNSVTLGRFRELAPMLGLTWDDLPGEPLVAVARERAEDAKTRRFRLECQGLIDELPAHLLPAVLRLLAAMADASGLEDAP